MARYQDDNGYVSMLDPNMFNFQMQLLNKKQQQYDTGYSIALDTKDKYSSFNTDPEDVPVRNQALDQFTGTVNDLVKSKYNGDWGQASKEVAGLVTKFKSDPVWETMQFAQKQRAMEDELTARYGPNYLGFKGMRGKSILGENGKLRSVKDMQIDVQERLQDLPVMDKLWDELSPQSLAGTHFAKRKLPNGQEVDVLVDSTGAKIDEKLVNKELNNMLKVYRDTPNYQQRVREYTELNGMSVDEAENKIKQDLLEVGMTKRKSTYQENWRVIDPDSYSSGKGKTDAMGYKGIPTGRATEDIAVNVDARKKVENLKRSGITNPQFDNSPSGILAKQMWDQVQAVMPESPSIENEVQKALLKNDILVDDTTLQKVLQLEEVEKTGTQSDLVTQQKQFEILRKEIPGKSTGYYTRIYNTIKDKQKEINKLYDKTFKVQTENVLDQNYGPADLVFTRPEPWTEQGAKQLVALNKINDPKEGVLKMNNFEFTQGSYKGEKWIKDDAKAIATEYKEKKTSPSIYSFTYNDQLGPRVQILNPDGLPQPAKLKNFDPVYTVSLMYAFGYPEAVNGYITENIKPGDTVPLLRADQPSDNPFTYRMKGEKGNIENYLYNKELGRNVTVGDMLQVENKYPGSDFGIPDNADPNKPFVFKRKSYVAEAADALYDILKGE